MDLERQLKLLDSVALTEITCHSDEFHVSMTFRFRDLDLKTGQPKVGFHNKQMKASDKNAIRIAIDRVVRNSIDEFESYINNGNLTGNYISSVKVVLEHLIDFQKLTKF